MKIINWPEETININNVTENQYIVAVISNVAYRVLTDGGGNWMCCNINQSKLSYELEVKNCDDLQSYIKYVMGFGNVHAFNTRKEARIFTNTVTFNLGRLKYE